ncbi:hypothetical protein GCM10007420_22220 [Glycocaulis albus]|uniref:Uncharacterized protein n=1 Tax=Glycocaulis albus TaxID=1382801 RepID=A0ABQ1XXB6_9PROT|nr:hypothetical protein GCM10007420_22220 [Glycocaulis albus]
MAVRERGSVLMFPEPLWRCETRCRTAGPDPEAFGQFGREFGTAAGGRLRHYAFLDHCLCSNCIYGLYVSVNK